jgi:hypothetical protein
MKGAGSHATSPARAAGWRATWGEHPTSITTIVTILRRSCAQLSWAGARLSVAAGLTCIARSQEQRWYQNGTVRQRGAGIALGACPMPVVGRPNAGLDALSFGADEDFEQLRGARHVLPASRCSVPIQGGHGQRPYIVGCRLGGIPNAVGRAMRHRPVAPVTTRNCSCCAT